MNKNEIEKELRSVEKHIDAILEEFGIFDASSLVVSEDSPTGWQLQTHSFNIYNENVETVLRAICGILKEVGFTLNLDTLYNEEVEQDEDEDYQYFDIIKVNSSK